MVELLEARHAGEPQHEFIVQSTSPKFTSVTCRNSPDPDDKSKEGIPTGTRVRNATALVTLRLEPRRDGIVRPLRSCPSLIFTRPPPPKMGWAHWGSLMRGYNEK